MRNFDVTAVASKNADEAVVKLVPRDKQKFPITIGADGDAGQEAAVAGEADAGGCGWGYDDDRDDAI